MRRQPFSTGCALGAALFAGGCDDGARPWASGDGPPAVLAPPRPGDSSAATETSGEGETPPFVAESAPSVALEAPAEARPQGPAVSPGGGWVTCAQGLVLSGDPLKDVTRLTLLCGPSNGMRRKARQAIVGLIGEHEPAVAAQLRVARGACYRVFAVAGAEVADLDVTVRSSRGVAVAADHSPGRLAIVQADRPFCTFADDIFTVEVSARRGAGRFAAEAWSLGERRKIGETLEMPADEPPLDTP